MLDDGTLVRTEGVETVDALEGVVDGGDGGRPLCGASLRRPFYLARPPWGDVPKTG
jgi:hypothetical protein